MIFDTLESTTARWLAERSPKLADAFAWIRTMPATAPNGITELGGPDFYVNVHGYATKPLEECRWESHRHTVDLQYCIAGGELIHWLPTGALASLDDYNPAKEVEHWRDAGSATTLLRMTPGSFAIFFANELHRPQQRDGTNSDVRKLVVKIAAHHLERM